MNATLADRELHVDVTPAVRNRLVELGFDPKMGARPLRRVIQDQVEDRLADYVLDHPGSKQLIADLIDDEIVIKATSEAPIAETTPATENSFHHKSVDLK